jgi:hypothetical protein
MFPVGGTTPHPSTIQGTREHAELVTDGRHPSVQAALQWLTYAHLPEVLQRFSKPFYLSAVEVIVEVADSPELTTALNRLVESKDWAVRAGIRSDTGRPGSIARPPVVVDPPVFGQTVADPPVFDQGQASVPGNYGPGQPVPRPLERD